MDVEVALATMRDESLDVDERLDAADAVDAWICRGGFVPRPLFAEDVLAECEALRNSFGYFAEDDERAS
jgi:hypothetical protein